MGLGNLHFHKFPPPHDSNADGLSVQFSSVTQSCLTLCDPMNHSTPGLPVHHQLPESTQTHVHWVGDAVQPSHPLSSPTPPVLIFPSIRVFSSESALRIRWPKYWSFSFNISPSSEHPGLISFRMDWFDSLQSKGLSRVFSNTTVQKHQFFGLYLDGKHKGSFLLCSYSSRQFFEKCLQKRSPLWAMATEKPNEVQDFLCPW